ncbi:MAG: ATP-binding protein [Bacteriovoracaceae bacterium]|nr:ATP-binding protein [Bacteriovoracaceae bacterium]
MWILRDLEQYFSSTHDRLPVQVIQGLRQSGKSSLLSKSLGQNVKFASLDDRDLRILAQDDPKMFFERYPPPVIIDEAHYAPNLFSEIKRRVDLQRREGSEIKYYYLTGSYELGMQKNVQESLVGRAEYLMLHPLSVHEILSSLPKTDIAKIIYQGGWPELYVRPGLDPKNYLNDYLKIYLEKDVMSVAGIEKRHDFLKFCGLLAARTSELLNYENISHQIGVANKTIRDWISILEQSNFISLLQPFHSNLNKRLLKTPKIYFLDTGLATRLQGHYDPELLMRSPQAGHLFENLVFCEIKKTIDHFRLDWLFYFWRTKDQEEVDFIIKMKNAWIVIDAKMAISGIPKLSLSHSMIETLSKEHCAKFHMAIVSYGGESFRLSENCEQIPLSELTSWLLKKVMNAAST